MQQKQTHSEWRLCMAWHTVYRQHPLPPASLEQQQQQQQQSQQETYSQQQAAWLLLGALQAVWWRPSSRALVSVERLQASR